jgi:hypothetical protein
MTVLLSGDKLPESVADEVRSACDMLGLDYDHLGKQMPTVAPMVVVAALAMGERHMGEPLLALLHRFPTARVILCAQEPLIKQRVVLGDGRVTVLSPPVDRGHLVSAIRLAIAPTPDAIETEHRSRFEVLRRTHWTAWSHGNNYPGIAMDEQRGTTISIGGDAVNLIAVANAVSVARSDAECESSLSKIAGSASIVHLNQEGNEWCVFWQSQPDQLLLCSKKRIPQVWRAHSRSSTKKLVRMPAFPQDMLIAVASKETNRLDLSGLISAAMEGGVTAFVEIQQLTRTNPDSAAVIVEAR